MTKKSNETFQHLRDIIMEEIFDNKVALKALVHLNNLEIDLQLTLDSVSDRENTADDRLMELQIEHEKALSLLKDMCKVIQNDRGADYHLLYQYEDLVK